MGFLKLPNGIFESSACSTGLLLAVFERALAEQVLELIAGNGFSQFETLIPSLASALGEPGLALLDGAAARIAATRPSSSARACRATPRLWAACANPLAAAGASGSCWNVDPPGGDGVVRLVWPDQLQSPLFSSHSSVATGH